MRWCPHALWGGWPYTGSRFQLLGAQVRDGLSHVVLGVRKAALRLDELTAPQQLSDGPTGGRGAQRPGRPLPREPGQAGPERPFLQKEPRRPTFPRCVSCRGSTARWGALSQRRQDPGSKFRPRRLKGLCGKWLPRAVVSFGATGGSARARRPGAGRTARAGRRGLLVSGDSVSWKKTHSFANWTGGRVSPLCASAVAPLVRGAFLGPERPSAAACRPGAAHHSVHASALSPGV